MEDGPAASRRRARRHVTTAVSLLVAAAFLMRLGSVAGEAMPWLFLAALAYALGAAAWWAVAVLRSPRPDPWAYDPELDGPIAQEMEGTTFAPPAPSPPLPRGLTLAGLALAALFLGAGAWLVGVAGRVYGTGNGAEAPSLSALALYLFAACLLAAGPWLAWQALRARP
jgi:hypothetical protein